MFGGHLPKLDSAIYETIHENKPFDTLEEKQKQYTVPFWIWANYDIEEESGISTSLNYLSEILLEQTGTSHSAYYDFLADMRTYIPQINSQGYYSETEHVWKAVNEANGIEKTKLNIYNIVQYNHMFDNKKKLDFLKTGNN